MGRNPTVTADAPLSIFACTQNRTQRAKLDRKAIGPISG
jgi:hypothetical protein